jgi:hypothetical protein
LPKPTHVRARSEGQATSSGGRHTEADPNGFGQGMGPSRLFSKRSAPELHAAFSEGSPTFGNTLSFAPSSPVWNSPVSIQSYLSTPSVASADQLDSRIIGQGVYEDEIESPSRATEWIDEGPSTEDSSPRVVKHNVTSRAMRLASDARMRSQARFPCRYCGQCLTTKGGLRSM